MCGVGAVQPQLWAGGADPAGGLPQSQLLRLGGSGGDAARLQHDGAAPGTALLPVGPLWDHCHLAGRALATGELPHGTCYHCVRTYKLNIKKIPLNIK